MKKIDVCIVGAGPTGLMMASELTRYGLSCRIIEKRKERSQKSKAIAIQARTLEILDILGIVKPFLELGVKIKGANPISKHHRIAYIDMSQLHSPYPFVLSLPQGVTERIFEEHLKTQGITVEREKEVVEFKKNNSTVQTTILDLQTSNKEELESSYVVGCDGAHSFVRKYLKFSFIGKSFKDVFSLADVKMKWKYPHDEIFAFPNSKGTIVALPLPKTNHYRLIFQLKRCRNALSQKEAPIEHLINKKSIPEPTLREAQDLIREFGDQNAELSDPEWLANFHVNSRLVSKYQKGRFFLAGDASHIHSPVGGQGMNTGIQDGFNLAWKLAFIHKKKINPDVLNTYTKERHETAKKLLKATELGTYFATFHNPIIIFFRNFFMSFTAKINSVQKKITNGISQLTINYSPNLITKKSRTLSTGPKAGYRAPNTTLYIDNTKSDLFTLMKNPQTFFILLFNNSRKEEEIKNHLSAQTVPIKIFSISKSTNFEAFSIFGIKNEGTYIIRPDGYIGFKESGVDVNSIFEYFKKISYKEL